MTELGDPLEHATPRQTTMFGSLPQPSLHGTAAAPTTTAGIRSGPVLRTLRDAQAPEAPPEQLSPPPRQG